MMNLEIIEIVLENVPQKNITAIYSFLSSKAEAITSETECIASFSKERILDEKMLKTIFNHDEDVCVLFKMENLEVGKQVFQLAILRIVKYSGIYDLDYNIDITNIKSLELKEFISELHNETAALAMQNDVKLWFCGLEPASDEDTRYFTKNRLGPMYT